MCSNDESVSVQLTEEERNYLYFLFSSKSKIDENKPKKIINLFSRKSTLSKSGSK